MSDTCLGIFTRRRRLFTSTNRPVYCPQDAYRHGSLNLNRRRGRIKVYLRRSIAVSSAGMRQSLEFFIMLVRLEESTP